MYRDFYSMVKDLNIVKKDPPLTTLAQHCVNFVCLLGNSV